MKLFCNFNTPWTWELKGYNHQNLLLSTLIPPYYNTYSRKGKKNLVKKNEWLKKEDDFSSHETCTNYPSIPSNQNQNDRCNDNSCFRSASLKLWHQHIGRANCVCQDCFADAIEVNTMVMDFNCYDHIIAWRSVEAPSQVVNAGKANICNITTLMTNLEQIIYLIPYSTRKSYYCIDRSSLKIGKDLHFDRKYIVKKTQFFKQFPVV